MVEAQAAAWTASELGRGDEMLVVLQREPFRSPWAPIAEAVARRDFRAAADGLREVGAVSSEAFYRLRAAEQLVEAGRRAEADKELRSALAFYASVGATRYIREGEALLAASA
jgi:hypothetical protein